jgi:parallel beta-helix repeat protein
MCTTLLKADQMRDAAFLSLVPVVIAAGIATAQPTNLGSPAVPQLRAPIIATAETLDIRDFGAKCDGDTDDYAAIAEVLARAGTHPGSTVEFPPSPAPCLVSSVLKSPDNVTLRASPGTVTMKASLANKSRPLLLALGNNTLVYGLSFDGGGEDLPNAANVIEGYHVSNVTIDHIAVRHSHGMAILMSSGIVHSTVSNSIFEDLGNHWKTTRLAKDRVQGVVFCCGTGNQGNTANNNQFSDIGLDALQFSEQSVATIMGNHFSLENGERGIVKAPDYPAAIFIMRVNRGTISGNVIEGAQGNGIDALALTNTTISNNVVTRCGAAGICLFDSFTYGDHKVNSDHVTISGNTLTNNGQWRATPHPGGITLGGTVSNVTLTDNLVADTQLVKTQKYGVYGHVGAILDNLIIDPSNRLDGNAVSVFGGTVSARDLRKAGAN